MSDAESYGESLMCEGNDTTPEEDVFCYSVRKRFHCHKVHVTTEETVLSCKVFVTAPGNNKNNFL